MEEVNGSGREGTFEKSDKEMPLSSKAISWLMLERRPVHRSGVKLETCDKDRTSQRANKPGTLSRSLS